MDELCCHFLGVADGDGVVATGDIGTGGDEAAIGSVVRGESLAGGDSKGSGGWVFPFLVFLGRLMKEEA